MKYRFASEGYTHLNIRMEPGKDAPVLGVMPKGTEFEGEADGEWVKVEGYVMTKFLTEEPENGKLEGMSVPELKKLAKDSGIKLAGNLGKDKIIEAILNG